MKTLLSTFKLSKNFDFFFFPLKNIFILKGLNGFSIIRLPALYFYFQNRNKFLFVLVHSFLFKTFLRNLYTFYVQLFFFFTFRLRLRGLGYRVKRISNCLYKFFFTFTNYFYLHLPVGVILKVYKKKLFFLSLNFWILRTLISLLLLLKRITVYKMRGLIYPRQIIIAKPGKKRF